MKPLERIILTPVQNAKSLTLLFKSCPIFFSPLPRPQSTLLAFKFCSGCLRSQSPSNRYPNIAPRGGISLPVSTHSSTIIKNKVKLHICYREGDHYVPQSYFKKKNKKQTAWSWKSFLIGCVPPCFWEEEQGLGLLYSCSPESDPGFGSHRS